MSPVGLLAQGISGRGRRRVGTEKIHNILDLSDKIVKNKKERNTGVQTLRIFKIHKVCTPMFSSFLFFTIFRKSSSRTIFLPFLGTTFSGLKRTTPPWTTEWVSLVLNQLKKGRIFRFQIEISKNQNSVKSTCTDLAIFKNSQGLYTYFSHCFDFWKFQFKKRNIRPFF